MTGVLAEPWGRGQLSTCLVVVLEEGGWNVVERWNVPDGGYRELFRPADLAPRVQVRTRDDLREQLVHLCDAAIANVHLPVRRQLLAPDGVDQTHPEVRLQATHGNPSVVPRLEDAVSGALRE